jgi:hypothetical protein
LPRDLVQIQGQDIFEHGQIMGDEELGISHPKSRHFNRDKINRDLINNYHERKRMSVAEVERWLRLI